MPSGATCEFYRPGGPFTTNYAYRLCFVDDRLVSKNAEIASRLFLVEGTVKAYVSAVLTRLGVRNRVQAAIVAYEAGLVDS